MPRGRQFSGNRAGPGLLSIETTPCRHWGSANHANIPCYLCLVFWRSFVVHGRDCDAYPMSKRAHLREICCLTMLPGDAAACA